MHRFVPLFALLIVSSLTAPQARADEEPWSDTVNGFRGRMEVRVKDNLNGTPILNAYLTLENLVDIVNPQQIHWDSNYLSVRIVDADGQELERAQVFVYSGGRRQNVDLTLPYDSSLTFNVSQRGCGIPKDARALLDFGPENVWIIAAGDNTPYFLEATISVPEQKEHRGGYHWHGTLKLPAVRLP
ncbi:MAG: hypothetical protein KDA69_06155 [Planctomycetaceae bacterium]|nr:hypothetical protein [Planctomycetaceae bacterium]MCA9043883.1 hypothetical protein [Planctomycetaceae bacterium]MCB9953538.1 hypothetical protein [Planctomycetaceae bacterium]